jgi:CheY-like chemotaxis protein
VQGAEVLILAEDDPGIRVIAEESLSRLGYRVLACADGESALNASIAAGCVDLLVTDLIMPGMNGKELAQRMMSMHRDLRVLYTSGYTADIIGTHGMLGSGIEFLPKPYLPSELARRIREILDAPIADGTETTS